MSALISSLVGSSLGKYLLGGLVAAGGVPVVFKLLSQYAPSGVHWLALVCLRQPRVKAYLDANPAVKSDLISLVNSSAAQIDDAIQKS